MRFLLVMAPPATPPPPPPATSAREFAASVEASLNADALAPVQYEAPKKGTLSVVVRTATGRSVVVWRGSRALRTREIGDVPLVLTAAGQRLLALGQPVRLRVVDVARRAPCLEQGGVHSRRPSPCVTMLQQIYAVVAVIASLAMCVVVIYFLWSGRHDRDKEEEAREYFDAHGHWPDEA